ncbi:MAG TPA: hypothetical protein VFL98_02680 [Candidatus Paceibacterota bacterium]|nr:hypothetical protein [Candidatus Paceibacterota bacterium]
MTRFASRIITLSLGAAVLACPLSIAAAASATPAPLFGMYARLEQLRGGVAASATAALPHAAAINAAVAAHAAASAPVPAAAAVARTAAQHLASSTAGSALPIARFIELRDRYLASTTAPHVAAILRDDAIATSTRLAILEYASTTRARIANRLAAFEASSTARQDARATRLGELRQKVGTKVYDAIDRVVSRLDEAYATLSSLLDTVSARAAAEAADGTDVTDADAAIETAQASLEDAQTAIDAAEASIGTAATSTSPARHMQTVRAATESAVAALKTAHQDVVAAMHASAAGAGIDADASAQANE